MQTLLGDVKAGLVDVILVYKVDRLTRSLADFAKLVELFDTHGVSFVSVTQSFNTTSSMGRLTLNVLLSFAQFEREVTGERIRDKIDASKKKGIWMGGTVPLGYCVENRKLLINPDEADTVRMIFEKYLALGSITALLTELNAKGIRTQVRQISSGPIGGVPFTPGPLTYLLKNRIYLGEIQHKEQNYPGEHEAIVDVVLFEAVQARWSHNLDNYRAARTASNAALLGKIFDDRGNKMTPTYSYKGKLRYRYYVSRALAEGRANEAGSVRRVPAAEVEVKVIEAIRSIGPVRDMGADDASVLEMAKRVEIKLGKIAIDLTDDAAKILGSTNICVQWAPKPTKAKRKIIFPHTDPSKDQRPIRTERRDALLRAVAHGRSWLKELSNGQITEIDTIATREGRSERSVQMMISLAFVAPDIIEAAVRGSLPRGIGLTRLMDLPPLWTDQRQALGLKV